ncbi:hypothetical protein N7447_007490 [Penicillium robsamsonii]|uniref:uncharacterized protein n=1 Tax=Penicillium robsamsonii TaxID=1792511 RepID=UPI00254876C8|nr:uncharacterized protein N7447_007490 [Penicillium robsamsonii]KAJ5817482.1 hypothetical protein N7447_007490 [Penicillium robsamsonii]
MLFQMITQVSYQWSAELQTLEGHSSAVHMQWRSHPIVGFGILLRLLWKQQQGQCHSALGHSYGCTATDAWGHSNAVTSLAFSPKGWL